MTDSSAGDDPEDERPRDSEDGDGADSADAPPADDGVDADEDGENISEDAPDDAETDAVDDARPTDETPFDIGGDSSDAGDEADGANEEDTAGDRPADSSPPDEEEDDTIDTGGFGEPPEERSRPSVTSGTGGDSTATDASDTNDGDEGESDDFGTDEEEFSESFGSAPESTYDSADEWQQDLAAGETAPDVADVAAAEGDDTPDPTVTEPVEAVGAGEGPETDEEMPLAVHIEEMVRRLAIVLGLAGLVTLFTYPISEGLVEFLWRSYIPGPDANRPHIYGPLEFVLTKLKVAGIAGTVVGLPVFVYQSYRFMKPGLYPTERRYYLASVPTSLILAFVGLAFSHFVILPLTMEYFTSYTSTAAVVAFGLKETFALIVLMMAYMAIVFQIPLFVMLAIMMGITTREWMEDKRLLFWGGFGGLAFTFVTVDPTGMAPIIIAVTMIVLFEGTLLMLRWTGN